MLQIVDAWLRPWVGLSVFLALGAVAVALPVQLHRHFQRRANRHAAIRRQLDERPIVLAPEPEWTGPDQPLSARERRAIWALSLLMVVWLAYALARIRIV